MSFWTGLAIVVILFNWMFILDFVLWIINDVFDIHIVGDPRPNKDNPALQKRLAEVKAKQDLERGLRSKALEDEIKSGFLYTRVSKVIARLRAKSGDWWNV